MISRIIKTAIHFYGILRVGSQITNGLTEIFVITGDKEVSSYIEVGTKFQVRFGFNVWIGFLHTKIIGPFFSEKLYDGVIIFASPV